MALVIQPISSDDAKIQYGQRPNSINNHSLLVSQFLVLLDVSIHGIFFVEARWQKTAAKIDYQPYHVRPSLSPSVRIRQRDSHPKDFRDFEFLGFSV